MLCTSTEVLGLTFKSSIKYFTMSTSPFWTAICIGCLPSYTHTHYWTGKAYHIRTYVVMLAVLEDCLN